MAMNLQSSAFAPMGTIPRDHTCEGANLSPPLAWSGVPEDAVTLVLTCDDPDAPRAVFHHWAVCNIPATLTCFAAGERAGEAALNDFGKPGYGGPCPPPGDRPHRYIFRLIALDQRLTTRRDLRCPEVAALAHGHELARAELIGLFGRQRGAAAG